MSPEPRHYGCAYTKARSNYTLKEITAITTRNSDEDIYKNEEESDATSLKQLLIDIASQDNKDFALLAQSDANKYFKWDDYRETSRIHRFSSAFNNFLTIT